MNSLTGALLFFAVIIVLFAIMLYAAYELPDR